MGHIAVVPTHYTPVVPLVPLESRALQRKSLTCGVHPATASRRPAAEPATGFSEGDIAPAACQVTRLAPPVVRKPRPGPQLVTCRLRAAAALASFAAADIELSVDTMLPTLIEAEAWSVPTNGPRERPPRWPERRQERRERAISEDALPRLQLSNKEILGLWYY